MGEYKIILHKLNEMNLSPKNMKYDELFLKFPRTKAHFTIFWVAMIVFLIWVEIIHILEENNLFISVINEQQLCMIVLFMMIGQLFGHDNRY